MSRQFFLSFLDQASASERIIVKLVIGDYERQQPGRLGCESLKHLFLPSKVFFLGNAFNGTINIHQTRNFLFNPWIFSLLRLKLHGQAYFFKRKISCVAPPWGQTNDRIYKSRKKLYNRWDSNPRPQEFFSAGMWSTAVLHLLPSKWSIWMPDIDRFPWCEKWV